MGLIGLLTTLLPFSPASTLCVRLNEAYRQMMVEMINFRPHTPMCDHGKSWFSAR